MRWMARSCFIFRVALLLAFVLPLNFASITFAAAESLQVPDCKGLATNADRYRLIDEFLTKLEEQIDQAEKDGPKALEEEPLRTNLGTFAAHRLPKAFPFSRLERQCWASFHEATRALEKAKSAKKSTAAMKAAGEWRTCLKVNAPQALEVASPLFQCFELKDEAK